MTTTQYTPGTIIVHEDEAHRILQINSKGHARTISDSGDAAVIDTNTLDAETIKVIPDANTETWITYITKAHTTRLINHEINRDQYKTEFRNALARYRKVMSPETVPTISLLDEATSLAAVQSYLESIIASIDEGKNKMKTLHNEFLATVPEILAGAPEPEFSIPEPGADSTVIKGYKFNIGVVYNFDVNVPAKDPEYPGDTEQVRRYAKVSRVTKTRAYVTFEDGSEGHVASAGSKTYYDLAVSIGGESYTVYNLGKYLAGDIEEIQESVAYEEAARDTARQIGEAYSKIVSAQMEENPFWAALFSTWAYRGPHAETAIQKAIQNLTNSMETAANVTAAINNLLEQLTAFED